jgi:hypothetical protein
MSMIEVSACHRLINHRRHRLRYHIFRVFRIRYRLFRLEAE